MMGAFLLSFAAPGVACVGASALDDEEDDDETVREQLKDPANVWPIFQRRVRQGRYSKAHDLVYPPAKPALPYELFYITFASFETPRRLVEKMEVHKLEAGPTSGTIRLCSPEFGVTREVKLAKFTVGKISVWTLEFSREDVDYFKGRPMAWYRQQVKSADGWHFAYPPDWTYAPLRRHCACGK